MKVVAVARRSLVTLVGAMFIAGVLATAPVTFAAPPSASSSVTSTPVQLSRALVFLGWMSYCNRYERQESVIVISPGKSQVKAFTCNFASGGAYIPFGADTTLTLTFDGIPVASTAVKASDTAVTFDVDLTYVNEGWYMASITGGLNGPWSILDYGVYVLKGATAQPHALMPVTTGSHELMFEGGGLYQQAWVPAKFEPVTVPYPSRAFPDLPTVPTRKDVVITSIAVPRPDDLYRPVLTKEGVWTTANRQNYFYYDFEQPKPILPMLDGPRGRGSIIAPVHLEVGNAAPNGALRGNIYFIESWRIGKVTPDGTVVTLAGYRHKDMASYWNDPTSAELVGDWSSIPANRRGFAQPWGMAWDPRTLVTNTSAPPIPSENNEQPHVAGPTLYVSDTYYDRVLKIAYSATAHGVPPKVTEFVTGLNQPWDVIPVGTQLYVSDRMNNAIKVFDMDTGALVKSIAVAQPEGMALLDGWLYYGSVLTKSIRKIELATGQDVLIADPSVTGSKMGYFINGNSRYMKIAVSDGSFGPRGMIAYTTWSNSYFGYPNLIDGATGNMIDWLHVNNGDVVKGTSPLGLHSYASAVGIGHGRMLFGTAEEGLHVVSKALPTDPVIDANKYKAGMDQWQAKGYGLTHGPAGYGFYGLPLPWGATPEIDYFLTANLHTPNTLGDATIAANPYGSFFVQGGTAAGNAISNFGPNATIQLGNTAGAPGSYAQIDFQGLHVGPGGTLTIASGAPGQTVILSSARAIASYIAGTLQAQGGNGAPPPALYVHNPAGVNVAGSGIVSGLGGLSIDALGSTFWTGQPITNSGVVDGGASLSLLAAKIGGGGAFKADSIDMQTFGNANNPVNSGFFLSNALQLYPGTGSSIALTVNAYGTTPQFLNFMLNGNGAVSMPSAWPGGFTRPANNAVVPPGATWPAGTPEPAYGGGSMIVQATGSLSLQKGPTNDFVFPGGLVFKAAGTVDVNGVTIDNAWTTSGKVFQGLYFEAPSIVSTGGDLSVLTNDQNWVNFSVRPTAPVRAWQLVRAPDGSASHLAADLSAPHINTYSTLINAAASGQCWVCLIDSASVDLR